uniref:hypothetical protein n=1 Tax=Hydrotalea sp. TaxID=2881279 RepID=UPI002635D8C4
EDKIKFLKIYIIPNFEALKDWYNVKLENYIEEIGNDCLSKTVKNVEIEKFKNNIISEVENHLQTNANNKFTGISSLHAEQLIKFYDWLQPQNNSAMEQQLQKEIKPIWWQGTGRQLGYLLDELAAKGFIDKNTNFNEAIKTHFVDKDKNPFTNSIKQNKSGTQHNTKSGGKPKGANQLDEIITAISKK